MGKGREISRIEEMAVNAPMILRTLALAVVLIVFEGFLGFLEPRLMEYVPNFCVVLVAIVALYEQSPVGAVLVFALGLFVDASGAGSYLGPWAAVYSGLYLVILLLPETLLNVSTLTLVFIACIGSFVGDLCYESLTFESWSVFALVWFPALIRSLIVALGTPVIFRCLRYRGVTGEFRV
jgi:hypothetical protein